MDEILEGDNENPAPQEENEVAVDPPALGFQMVQQDEFNLNPAPHEEIAVAVDPPNLGFQMVQQIQLNLNPVPHEEIAVAFDLPALGVQIDPQEVLNLNPAPHEENAMALDPHIAALGFQIIQQEELNLPDLAPIPYRHLDLDDEDIVEEQNFNLQAATNHLLRAPRLIPEVREIVKLKGSIIEPNRYLCVAGDGVTEYNLIIPEGFMLNNLLQDGLFVVINIHQDVHGNKNYVLHRLIENNLVIRHYMYRGEWPQHAIFHVDI